MLGQIVRKCRGVGDGAGEIGCNGRGGAGGRLRVGAADPDAGGPGLETAGNRPRHRRAQDGGPVRADAAEGAVSGRQDRARGQIRAGRPAPARRLHAGGQFGRAAGADLHPWRRLRRRQQAHARQPVLRQHHAVGGEERLCRRQRHLPTGAAVAVAGPEDLASVVQWVSEKIAERGGDPARIFLMGQSAGAIHVAGYVSHPEFHKVKGGGLAGAVMVSGLYDLTASPAGDAEIAYFGSDPTRYAERSSLQGLLATKIPLVVSAAELDPPRFVEQYELIKQASCKRASGCARTYMLPQHSHISEVYAVNTADTRL